MKTVYCPNCGEKMIGESAGWRCLKCKGFISFTDGEFYPYIERPFTRPITNADRIRAMSDEKLVLTMMQFCVHYDAYHDEDRYYLPRNTATTWTNSKNCAIKEWLEWLQQPAEEDT